MLFWLGLLCFSNQARAINCASAFSTVSNWYVDFGRVTDNPTLPIGGVLATGRVVTPGLYPVTLNCTGTGAAAVVSIRPACSTDVPVGTGLAISLLYNGSAVRSDTAYRTYSSVGTYTIEATGVGISAQLIKTGATTSWTTGLLGSGCNWLAHRSLGRVAYYLWLRAGVHSTDANLHRQHRERHHSAGQYRGRLIR